MEALSLPVAQMEDVSFGPTLDDAFGPANTDADDSTSTREFGSYDQPAVIPVMATDLHIEIASLVGEGKESGAVAV